MSNPRTTVEFVDYEQAAKYPRPLPHKTARVLVNGSEVRLARDGLMVDIDHEGTTRVTLELLPDEVHFVASSSEPEPKFQPGDRVRGKASGRLGTVIDKGAYADWIVEFSYPSGGRSVEPVSEGLLELVEPEPQPEPVVVQGAWTLRERERRQPKPQMMIHATALADATHSMSFQVTDESADAVRRLFFPSAIPDPGFFLRPTYLA